MSRHQFVELKAELSERLIRNESEFRLSHKPSKRDLEKSRERLLEHDKEYRFNSDSDFFSVENYLKINNTSLPARVTARMIVDKFSFSNVEGEAPAHS